MRPTDYPVQYAKLLEQWNVFTESDSTMLDLGFLDPITLQSWQRCSATQNPYQPRPVSRVRSSQIQSLLQKHNAWLSSAIPHVEEVLQCLDGGDHALLLTDRLGCALYLAGHDEILETIEAAQLGIGSYWSEESVGTNAIGLTLQMVMPIQIVGPEHFCRYYHQWGTTAAPIHDDEGRLLGTIGLISHAENATRRDRALVMSAASAISGLLQTERYLVQANQQLFQMNAILDELDRGVLMWDAYGRIAYCNSTASDILGLATADLRGKDVDKIIRWPMEIENVLANGSDLDDSAIELRVLGHRVHCSLAIRVMNAGRVRRDASENYFVALLSLDSGQSNQDFSAERTTQPDSGLTMEDAERLAIVRAGMKHQGVVTKMAAELSIGRTTLWRKMRAFDIDPADFKETRK